MLALPIAGCASSEVLPEISSSPAALAELEAIEKQSLSVNGAWTTDVASQIGTIYRGEGDDRRDWKLETRIPPGDSQIKVEVLTEPKVLFHEYIEASNEGSASYGASGTSDAESDKFEIKVTDIIHVITPLPNYEGKLDKELVEWIEKQLASNETAHWVHSVTVLVVEKVRIAEWKGQADAVFGVVSIGGKKFYRVGQTQKRFLLVPHQPKVLRVDARKRQGEGSGEQATIRVPIIDDKPQLDAVPDSDEEAWRKARLAELRQLGVVYRLDWSAASSEVHVVDAWLSSADGTGIVKIISEATNPAPTEVSGEAIANALSPTDSYVNLNIRVKHLQGTHENPGVMKVYKVEGGRLSPLATLARGRNADSDGWVSLDTTPLAVHDLRTTKLRDFTIVADCKSAQGGVVAIRVAGKEAGSMNANPIRDELTFLLTAAYAKENAWTRSPQDLEIHLGSAMTVQVTLKAEGKTLWTKTATTEDKASATVALGPIDFREPR